MTIGSAHVTEWRSKSGFFYTASSFPNFTRGSVKLHLSILYFPPYLIPFLVLRFKFCHDAQDSWPLCIMFFLGLCFLLSPFMFTLYLFLVYSFSRYHATVRHGYRAFCFGQLVLMVKASDFLSDGRRFLMGTRQ